MAILSFNDLKKNLKKDAGDFPKVKVALLGDSATGLLSVALKGMGIERGYNTEMLEADYNQVERQFLDKSSELYAFNADFIIVFHSTHKLLQHFNNLEARKQNNLARERIELVRLMAGSVSSKLIYYNYPEIDDSVFGSYANKTENSFSFQARKLNYELMLLSQQVPNLFICDLASLQNTFGRNLMFSPAIYVNTEITLSPEILPDVASRTLDIIDAISGKLRKCLILDLDNTVWGGVIGDDGIENIQLGHGLGIGKAFTEFQQWAKKLKNRGIILAVCSKNNEDTAKEPFEKHPGMVLKLDDIAVFISNWENKVDNIRKIQSILNIGFDSMVFIDDNPFERDMVRQYIPGITIPELPEDPASRLEYLYSLNLFETASYNSEDTERTRQYQTEAARVSVQKSFENEADFLRHLEMVSEVSLFDKFTIPRIAQLSQRSNQFNLRTFRFTGDELEKLSYNNKYQCFSFGLKDKYGDNGLICAVILEKQNSETLFVDSWFMSCRVLKRGMENFTLNVIINYARKNKFTKIMGEFIPTPKNKLVENHYNDLGFLKISGETRNLFSLDVDSYTDHECYIIEEKKY